MSLITQAPPTALELKVTEKVQRPQVRNLTCLKRPPSPTDQLIDLQAIKTHEESINRLGFLQTSIRNHEATIKHLQTKLHETKNKIERVKAVPLIIGQLNEIIDEKTATVNSFSGILSVVKILSTVDRSKLKPNAIVSLNKNSLAVVDILPPESDTSIVVLAQEEKPDVQFSDIGGLEMQKTEIRETVELPLSKHSLYKQIGIDPPRGVLLYGPPGTGKTMLVKAVANSTNATFIKVSGSEFVQKYSGEGPRMVRDVFRLAREKAPSIIFIDEVDAIATTRFDGATSADKEVQRVLIELLNQMDGFDQHENVKVIMATNRADTLDPALLRPGRLDRKIEFPNPDKKQKRLIFAAITNKMALFGDVDLESFIDRSDVLSAADIQSICQEAGMFAVRNSRYTVHMEDFEKAYSKVLSRKKEDFLFYK
ncbi:26S proteasome regulatory subunit 6B like protein [Cucumispora dikerogammari]|nr:26S proteasome regulatory subunit 6B like protein [Cucumispora dikerogammari]